MQSIGPNLSVLVSRSQRLLIAVLFLSTTATAQDFDRYAPQTPVVTPVDVSLPHSPLAAVEGSTDVIVGELKGVMILDHESRIQDPIKEFSGIRIDPAAELSVAREDDFADAIRSHLGKPISIRGLNEMARSIVWSYQDYGQPVVDVSIPPGQDITDGIVQVVITESTIDCVRFRGNCEFSDCLLQQQTWLRNGQRLYVPCLENELVWFNSSPYRSVNLTLEPGSAPGTTDVIFDVCEKRLIHGYMGYDDAGVQLLERERVFAGFSVGNITGNDDQLAYRYTADAYFSGAANVHSLVYSRPIFENRDAVSIFANWADYEATPAGAPLDGTSWQVSGRYQHTLCQNKCQHDKLYFGIDVKGTDNTFEFYRSANMHNVNIVNFMVGLSSLQQYRDGHTTYGVDLFVSPSNILSNNRSSDFGQLRTSADATYAYIRGNLERLYSVNCHSDFVVRATGQLGSARLLPSEQLHVGGYNSIRGYNMNTVNGDSGYIANFEYRTKPLYSCCNGRQSSFTALAFGDLGQQFNYGSDATLLDDQFLASVGVGCRYMIDPNCTIRLDYGLPLAQAGLADAQFNKSGRVHIGAVFAY